MATSCLLNAINDVLTAIAAIPHDWGADSIVHSRPNNLFQLVRMWNNQVAREQHAESEAKGGYTFEKPACFLEMIPDQNNQFLDSTTNTDYVWRMHIVDEELDAGNGLDMDQNLEVFTYRDAVRQALVGYQPRNCSTLFAIEEKQDFEHGSVYHLILDLKSCLTDTKGSYLDPDQDEYIYETPPTDAELVIGFQNPITDAPLADPLTLEIIPT